MHHQRLKNKRTLGVTTGHEASQAESTYLPRVGEGSWHPAGSGARAVPLRTRTVASQRLRIDTYHDNKSMREALEQLKRMCGFLPLDDEEEINLMCSSSSSGRNGARHQFNQLPGHLVIYCFSFCDLPSLGQVSRVCRRLGTFANAHHLWEAHAQRLNKPTKGPLTAREDLRFEVWGRWNEEIERHRQEYEELERRLQERAAAERATVVDVDTLLADSRRRADGGGGGGSYRLRGGNTNVGISGDSRSAVGSRSDAEVEELYAQVQQLEATKQELLRAVHSLKETLAQQREEVQEVQRKVEISMKGESDANVAAGTDGSAHTSGATAALTLNDIFNFERRICRLVLSTVPDLPIVLRRGIDDFSVLEMLVQHGGGDVGSCVRQRWNAFKSFFPPVSNDYCTLRLHLLSGESLQASRAEGACERVSGVIRRMLAMSDDEITQIVMQTSFPQAA
uniref:WGS project CAEQ00000000 data, annotated contig 235 n=1 Tax=Trypanosoma congolense (strain IL3000) TaxID=1068625 RepID=F9WDC5_TRYCI|nr:unnamed protein product [Trypanosoma congolense IL3000]